MKNTEKYLKLLSATFPTARKAASEIINLSANLNLPKGTEHFISDIHGEFDGFNHILKNGSGSIAKKVEDEFGDELTVKQKKTLCTLIYYPEEKLELIERTEADIHSVTEVVDTSNNRLRISDTDKGKEMQERISDLKELISCYKRGILKEHQN